MRAVLREAKRLFGVLGTAWAAIGPALLAGAYPAAAEEITSPQSQAVPMGGASAVDAAQPVELSVVYTADLWSNLRGGIKRASRYLDNLDVMLTVDGERALGLGGATVFVHGIYNNGNSLSEEVVGDLQVVSNIDAGVRAARILEAWLEQRMLGDRASVKVGLYDLNSEFDTNDSSSLFINSSHGIGPDFSQSGLNGPSIFPVTSLALRADYEVAPNWLVRAAILDAVPGDPARPKRTAIKLGDGEGALLVGEVAYQTDRTKVAVGHWRYTSAFEHLLRLDPSGQPALGRGKDGAYAMVERKLTSLEDDRGLSGWLRFGIADQKYNAIRHYAGGGLVYTGPFAGRTEDKLGAAIGVVTLGSPYRDALRRAGTASDAREVGVELTYRAPLAPWLTVQPDFQYVVNPGGDPSLGDALVIGMRMEVGF